VEESGAGRKRRNAKTVWVSRCVLFCFRCSETVFFHVRSADGTSGWLRSLCPLELPFQSGNMKGIPNIETVRKATCECGKDIAKQFTEYFSLKSTRIQ
jgi:hypothetical protein